MGQLRRPGPVGSRSPGGSREPRRQDGPGARAGGASRRDDQPLVAVCRASGSAPPASITEPGYDSFAKQTVPEAADTKGWQGGARSLVGNRHRRTPARGRRGGGRRHARGRGRCEGRSSPGVTDVATQLLHARRRAAPARHRARDIGCAGRNAAPRNGAPTRGSRDAVRRRARADRGVESARSDSAARDACRRVASPHRGADWRPGVQRVEHRCLRRGDVDRSRGACWTTGRAAAAPAGPARREGTTRCRQCAPPTGDGRMVPAPVPRRHVRPRRPRSERRRLWAPHASAMSPRLLAMPIFNAGRTQAINDIAESGQKEAVLRYEDAIVRALEDVENALVALDDEQQRAQLLQSAAVSADAALGRAQSLYDRGQIDLLPLLDAQRVRLAVRVGCQRRQHATAARQRATLQGARRRLAGVRAFRQPRPPPAQCIRPNS